MARPIAADEARMMEYEIEIDAEIAAAEKADMRDMQRELLKLKTKRAIRNRLYSKEDDELSQNSRNERSVSPIAHPKEDIEDTNIDNLVKDREIKEAEMGCVRIGGILYISDELWIKHRHSIRDCHIYVGSSNLQTLRHNSAINKSDISSKHTTSGQQSNEGVIPRTDPPERFRIFNAILASKMEEILQVSQYNHDHIPPFRSIIPFHKKFRDSLRQTEEEFEQLKALYPDDEAITLINYQLPEYLTYRKNADELLHVPITERVRVLLDGLRCLVDLLDHEFAKTIETYEAIQSKSIQKINFNLLYYLFEPGQEVIYVTSPQLYRVLHVCGGRKSLVPRRRSNRRTVSPLIIDCFFLDFDAKQVGPVQKSFMIPPYDGLQSIDSLGLYPLCYDQNRDRLSFINRGKKFAEVAETAHKKYKGLSLKEGDRFDRYEEIDSDVIIDFTLAFRNSQPKIETPEFVNGGKLKLTEADRVETHAEHIYYDDEELTVRKWSQFYNHTHLLDPKPLCELDDESYVLLTQRVYAYVLLSRKWYPLDIDLIEDVPKLGDNDADGFSDLILPRGHKDVVRALVKTHARTETAIDPDNSMKHEFDLVKGKGKGLIILLHGAPGVGKTSTAECVAANTGRPLFPITCGDIGGTTAQEVEENLERFFDLARKWGCVLLLDEADVFLKARGESIAQNSLVSVFLRVLEYYSGILILTTNRVGQFDEAISSRVHCALYYPPLGKADTLAVWNMNMDRLERQNKDTNYIIPINFDRHEIERFAKDHWNEGNRWNGRQIKNAFQTAAALADWDHIKSDSAQTEGLRLGRKHFKKVAKASTHFEKYMIATRSSDETRARLLDIREDAFELGLAEGHKNSSRSGKKSFAYGNTKSVESQLSYSESESDSDKWTSESEQGRKSKKGKYKGTENKSSKGRHNKSGKSSKKSSKQLQKSQTTSSSSAQSESSSE